MIGRRSRSIVLPDPRLSPRSFMNRIICALCVVSITVGLHAQLNVSGPWEITLDTHVGESTWNATFEQDGSTLTGEMDIGDRENFPLKGTIDGRTIEFVFVMPDLDGDQPINLSGSVDSDGTSMVGDEGSFSWYGTGSWTAVEQAS